MAKGNSSCKLADLKLLLIKIVLDHPGKASVIKMSLKVEGGDKRVSVRAVQYEEGLPSHCWVLDGERVLGVQDSRQLERAEKQLFL